MSVCGAALTATASVILARKRSLQLLHASKQLAVRSFATLSGSCFTLTIQILHSRDVLSSVVCSWCCHPGRRYVSLLWCDSCSKRLSYEARVGQLVRLVKARSWQAEVIHGLDSQLEGTSDHNACALACKSMCHVVGRVHAPVLNEVLGMLVSALHREP